MYGRNTRTPEEGIISKRLNDLINPFGMTSILHKDEYASMDIQIVTTGGKRVCQLDIETKPDTYAFAAYYPNAHPAWVTIPGHNRGWSFLYRKVSKLEYDPRGRELVNPDDLYVLCDKTCEQLFVSTFGDIKKHCTLDKYNQHETKTWTYRHPAMRTGLPSFIHVDGNGYGFIVDYLKSKSI